MVNDNKKYVFIGKTLFFPKEKVLAIGDLHLGYEESLRQGGLDVPIKQLEEVLEEIEKVLENIRVRYGKIEKIIFLGDVKHHFNYLATEREELKKLISFLKKKGIEEQNIIFIRGNHEKNEKNEKFVDFYIEKDICFIHGYREFLEIYDRTINLIVMGHIHPTIILKDKMQVKREKYKCFLVGRYKKKEIIVVPSFHAITEGVCLTEFLDEKGYDYSIVPNQELKNFEVYVVSELGEDALNFGELKKLQNS